MLVMRPPSIHARGKASNSLRAFAFPHVEFCSRFGYRAFGG
jgi:hypothetical protein